jgi:hypothetical protein
VPAPPLLMTSLVMTPQLLDAPRRWSDLRPVRYAGSIYKYQYLSRG